MKHCYYRLTNINVEFDQTQYTVLAHIANRQDEMKVAIRSYISDHTPITFDYEPVAAPLDELELTEQPYDINMTDLLHAIVLKDVVDIKVAIDHPTEMLVSIEMPDNFRPLIAYHDNYKDEVFNDSDLREYLIQELNKYLPININYSIMEAN